MDPYTGSETRILLSFAMKSGGHLFSQWLRNKLMLALNYFSTNSVYLDTVASRDHETVHNLVQVDPKDQLPGKTYVAPDRRNEKTEGFTAIGAMNSGWNDSYLKAMSEARVFLVILNSDYTDSKWCMQEWEQFTQENERRRGKGLPEMYGMVIQFVGELGLTKPINLDKVDVLTFPKVMSNGGSSTALRANPSGPTKDGKPLAGVGWEISESSLLQIVEKIKPYR